MHREIQQLTGEHILGAIACLILLAFGFAILRRLDRWIHGQPRDEDAEKWALINAEVPKPRKMPDGTYKRARIEWETCDAPREAHELIVHDKSNPKHVASCTECREGRKFRSSGVSFRSN